MNAPQLILFCWMFAYLVLFVRKCWKHRQYRPVKLEYHNCLVVVNDVTYKLFNSSYGFKLQCTRVGGWELWHTKLGVATFIGGEYDPNTYLFKVSLDDGKTWTAVSKDCKVTHIHKES